MGVPGIQAALLAKKLEPISSAVRKAPLAPPPAPARPVAAPKVYGQEDLRVSDFAKRSGALPPVAEGHTRLYRVGDLATEHPPLLPDDIVTDLWGNKLRRSELEKQKGPTHSSPAAGAGRWFTDAADQLDFYIKEDPAAAIHYVDIPSDRAAASNVRNTPLSSHSRNHEREFVLGDDELSRATRLLDRIKKASGGTNGR